MITRAADYALRATIVLAGRPPGARLCLSDLADECDVPRAYLYKVLQALSRRGLVQPHRGVTGGYELTNRARDASVLDVVEAMDGLPMLNSCVLSGHCHRSPACPAHPVWVLAQDKVREVLSGARIGDLANTSADTPAAGRLPQDRRLVMCGPTPERPGVAPDAPDPAPVRRRPRGPNPKRMEDR
jgi:Rrf2 family transcriptional regulator, iron-sulfur cluster assembly transcription factor